MARQNITVRIGGDATAYRRTLKQLKSDTLAAAGVQIYDVVDIAAGTLAVTIANSDSTAPTITAHDTADLNGDGFIDAIHITFDEAVDDSTVTATDFAIAGASNPAFSSTTDGDTADDADIYITFDDGVLDTGSTAAVTYTAGSLKDINGNSLATGGPTASTDTAAPVVLSATSMTGSTNLVVTF